MSEADSAPQQIDAGGALPEELAFDVHELPGGLPAVIEAVLMVADEPIPVMRLASILAVTVAEVEQVLADLAAEYRGEGKDRPRGFELREVAGGWRIYSSPVMHEVTSRFVLDGQTSRLTQAALETLAIVAYRQPVSRGQVSAIRGVSVDGVVRTLTTRGLIEEIGIDEGSGALLYGTTTEFLERMGLVSLDDLPELAPYLPELDALDDAHPLTTFGGSA